MKIYLLDEKDLKIIGEADNYEAIYDLMQSDKFSKVATLVSYNPPLASILIWEAQQVG